MDAERLWMLVGAAVVFVLGAAHLMVTFRGRTLLPRDEGTVAAMKGTSLRISRDVNLWNAWIGFNASHSLGAMLFGLVYGFMAWTEPAVLFGSWFLQSLGVLLLTTFVWLAWRYWFRGPLVGVSVALACFVIALAVAHT